MYFPFEYHDVTHGLSTYAGAEARLLGKPEPPTKLMPFGVSGNLSDSVWRNSSAFIATTIETSYGHRLSCVAGTIAVRYRSGAGLPTDAAALVALLPATALDARDADDPALRYERLTPSRFRIGLDPAGPLPPMIPADRWGPGYASTIGTPSSTKAADVRCWSIEIDLDAILIPPPPKKSQ